MLAKGFFQLAKSASMNSNHRYRVGCVIALHGKPVTVGFNVCKSHPQYTTCEHPSIHAEVKAIINARCNLQGGIAYVYRETRNGKPALAKPCDLCYSILQEAGIKTVYYSTSEYPYWSVEKL